MMSSTSNLEFDERTQKLLWKKIHIANMRYIIEDDELFQELCMVWLNCRDAYEPNEKTKFSTFLWYAVNNYIVDLRRKYDRRTDLYSLDYNVSDKEREVTLSDFILDIGNNAEEELEREEILFKLLSHKNGWLVRHLLNGKTHQEIANKYKMERSKVSRKINELIEDTKRWYR